MQISAFLSTLLYPRAIYSCYNICKITLRNLLVESKENTQNTHKKAANTADNARQSITRALANARNFYATCKRFLYKLFLHNASGVVAESIDSSKLAESTSAQSIAKALLKIASKYIARHIGAILLFSCAILGLFSMFVFGALYEYKLGFIQSAQERQSASTRESKIAKLDSIEASQSAQDFSVESNALANAQTTSTQKAQSTPSAPTMPKPDERESVISGNLTYQNAISIAQECLGMGDFSRARIWIYRAYTMRKDAARVWELYQESFEKDYYASAQEKQKAKALYLQARAYYGF